MATLIIWCHPLVFTAVYASHKLRLSPRFGRGRNRGIGILFVRPGVMLASDQRAAF
ncbi:MAG: hypothetical protein ACRCWL_07335 [Aeromonas sp.]